MDGAEILLLSSAPGTVTRIIEPDFGGFQVLKLVILGVLHKSEIRPNRLVSRQNI
jgi:hypothetical protein